MAPRQPVIPVGARGCSWESRPASLLGGLCGSPRVPWWGWGPRGWVCTRLPLTPRLSHIRILSRDPPYAPHPQCHLYPSELILKYGPPEADGPAAEPTDAERAAVPHLAIGDATPLGEAPATPPHRESLSFGQADINDFFHVAAVGVHGDPKELGTPTPVPLEHLNIPETIGDEMCAAAPGPSEPLGIPCESIPAACGPGESVPLAASSREGLGAAPEASVPVVGLSFGPPGGMSIGDPEPAPLPTGWGDVDAPSDSEAEEGNPRASASGYVHKKLYPGVKCYVGAPENCCTVLYVNPVLTWYGVVNQGGKGETVSRRCTFCKLPGCDHTGPECEARQFVLARLPQLKAKADAARGRG